MLIGHKSVQNKIDATLAQLGRQHLNIARPATPPEAPSTTTSRPPS